MEGGFDQESVKHSATEMFEKIIGSNSYQHNKVDAWSNEICESVINFLIKKGWAYKFIVTNSIVQKTGAGFHSSTSCYWEQSTDHTVTIRWENKNMHCTLQIFAIAF